MSAPVADPPDILDAPNAAGRVVRGGVLRAAGFAVGTGLALLGAALVTRHLGPADYGRFQTVVALVTVVAAVGDLGVSTLTLRELSARRGAQRGALLELLLGLRLATAAVAVAIAVLAALALGYDTTMVGGAALVAAGSAVGALQATLAAPLSAQLRLGAVATLDVLRQALTTGAYVALVAAGAGLTAFYAVSLPAQALCLAATVAVLGGTAVRWRPRIDPRAWRSLVAPVLSFGLATASGQLYIYTALILTGLVASAHETGLFAAAFRVVLIVGTVPGILVTGAFPLLSRAAREDRARLTRQLGPLLEGAGALGGAALLACVLGAPAILGVLAGDAFADAASVLRVQGLALALTFLIAPLGFALLALGRQRAMLAGNLMALAVSGATVIALASAHGARGAAWATVLGEATLAVAYTTALLRDVRPVPGRLPRAAVALVVGLAAGALPGWSAAVAATVGLAVYAAALVALRAVPDQVRAALRQRQLGR